MTEGLRIGVMGGTFDPIHYGHLVAAEEARYQLDLDRVLFVPAGRPWQKEDVTSATHRLEMTRLATQSNERFEVSTLEIDRRGPTYTVDTLRQLRREQRDASLFFVTGADAILDILTWKDANEALGIATFVAASRPGYDLDRLGSLGADVRARIVVIHVPALAISSTDIRDRVTRGAPIRYLVPDAVADYIAFNDLYRG